ncbi:MAG: hypothetical protein ACE5PT_01165 [Gemmatimonadales bacterium]
MAMHDVPPGVSNPPSPIPPGAEQPEKAAPGTLVLVAVFLVAFIVYYFVNWNLLSFIWQVG